MNNGHFEAAPRWFHGYCNAFRYDERRYGRSPGELSVFFRRSVGDHSWESHGICTVYTYIYIYIYIFWENGISLATMGIYHGIIISILWEFTMGLYIYIYHILINMGMMNVDQWWNMNGWIWVNLITTSLWPHCDLIVRKGNDPHSWPQDSG